MGARPSWLSEQLYPFERRYAEVQGVTGPLRRRGNRPPLLLMHGSPTWSVVHAVVNMAVQVGLVLGISILVAAVLAVQLLGTSLFLEQSWHWSTIATERSLPGARAAHRTRRAG